MIEPRDFFGAEEHNIRSLFSQNITFIVPDYQRNFAWTHNELQHLWEDFQKVVKDSFDDNHLIKPDHKPHFFGTILVTESPNGSRYEITDGQQRLTTVSILLKCLLEEASRIGDMHAQAGIRAILTPLVQRSQYGEPFVQKFELDSTINDFYRDYILLKNSEAERAQYIQLHPIGSNNTAIYRLKMAHSYFVKKIREELPETLDQQELHNKLLCFVLTITRLFLILQIVVKESETAYTIFGTLNNRGKDLTDSDIIKNELFKRVPMLQRSIIKEKWDSIIECIENEDLTEYIRFHYASKIGPVKKVELFGAVTEYLNNNDAAEYLDSLFSEADWYARVNLIGATYWNDAITHKLDGFKHLDISHSIPLLLTGAVKYNHNSIDFERIVNATLVFCFRYFTIAKNSVADLEREVGLMSRALRNPLDLSKLSQAELQSIPEHKKIVDIDSLCTYMLLLTSNANFVRHFRDFSTKTNSLAFYVLNELEKKRMTGVIPLPHGPAQHIEHIMPKKPSKRTSRLHEWGHVRNNPEYSDFVYRIGNMVILESDINQQVSNKDFSVKLTLYNASGLSYPRDISAAQTHWDFASINNRQTLMAQEALSIWRYY
ncbi:DUF262 domain-containing protein [Paenibacillus taichungensis]|uniref:DUF262 domain-containing protein n=1 Tax=Paenibacillus taichungensis TaxID=484184 RepID=UPI0035D6BF51